MAQHIAHDNNFLTSVTEYRCTDLKGFMCSNAFTSFLSGTSDTHECVKALQKVAKLLKLAKNCLLPLICMEYLLLGCIFANVW